MARRNDVETFGLVDVLDVNVGVLDVAELLAVAAPRHVQVLLVPVGVLLIPYVLGALGAAHLRFQISFDFALRHLVADRAVSANNVACA